MHLLRDQYLHADGNIASFDEAMELVITLWNKIHPDCLFTEDQPMGDDPESMQLPHIVYDLVHRKHADRLSDGRKPRQMKIEPDPDQVGHNLVHAVEWFDCVVDFIVFGRTKKESRQWAHNLENFFIAYTGYLKKQGIQDMLFEEEYNTKVSTEYRQDLPHRYLRYSVRIQRTQILRTIRLDDVDVAVLTPPNEKTNGAIEVYPNNEFMDLYREHK
jgi:hypothetical protein